jgi:hypothetical protein
MRSRIFGEHRDRDLVALERAGRPGVRQKVDEEIDDLVLGDTAVERDPQLARSGSKAPSVAAIATDTRLRLRL